VTDLPEEIRAGVWRAIRDVESSAEIAAVRTVGGGCINNGARIETESGSLFFLKWNGSAPLGLFGAEADGLRALIEALPAEGSADRIRVPEPIAWEDAGHGPAWLLLEHAKAGAPLEESHARLGRGLAAVHDAGGPPFGWRRDNWIGSLPQANAASDSWSEFWRDRRIVPQLEAARGRGHFGGDVMDRLVESIPTALAGVERPALLHGDLWSGNAFVDTDGVPVLIDPAVYVGDGEVDVAMTELFGGFGRAFYAAYDERRPISAEYRAFRRDLYQLYYLLVHVNLFGGSYVAGAHGAAERVVAEVGRG
jgi:protein-ribulosamine 3-kinase